MKTLKDRVEFLKKEHSIKPKQLADALLMSYDAFRMAVKRETLTEMKFDKIEQDFGISKDWLSSGSGDVFLNTVGGEDDSLPLHGVEFLILDKLRSNGTITSSEIDVLHSRFIAANNTEKMLSEMMEVLRGEGYKF